MSAKADLHRPERRTLWRHPRYRDRWRVLSVGPKWVTLETTFPVHGYGRTLQVPADQWPRHQDAEWVRA